MAAILWAAVASQAVWLWFPVVWNSLIHAFMYSYYLVKTLRPSAHIPAARYLTSAQIAQFVAGLVWGSGVLVLGDSCEANRASRFALTCLSAYGCGLLVLFLAFARNKYGVGSKSRASLKKKAVDAQTGDNNGTSKKAQ